MLLDDKDCTSWIEHDNSYGMYGDADAEHAAEAGEAHYVTGIMASMKYSGSAQPGTVKLYDGTSSAGTVIAIYAIQGHAPSYAGNSLAITFPHPIQITTGNAVTVTITPDSTSNNTAMDAVIMGFTLKA